MRHPRYIFIAALAFFLTNSIAFAQGTAFSYQGRLNSSGTPANGSYDLQFTLFNTNATGTAIAGPVTNTAVSVTNGLFTTLVNFGPGVFTGSSNWLQIAVSTNAANSFSTLTPRQQVTPVPYALVAANVSGVLASANLPSGPTIAGTVTAGAFSGNGANVTNVNAATLNGQSAGNFWQLGGNNVAGGQFIGSTNNQPVEIWQNNLRVYRASYVSNQLNGYSPSLLGGFSGNYISNGVAGAAIGGGGSSNQFIYTPQGLAFASFLHFGTNSVTADFGTVPGGFGNTVSGVGGTASGVYTTASAYSATALGFGSQASGNYAVAEGYGSLASGDGSVALGYGCQATNSASVALGESALALGPYALAMGYRTIANGTNSFAAGNQAQAINQGTFVWADSQNAAFADTAANQFLIRASGGVGVNTTTPGAQLDVAGASGTAIRVTGPAGGGSTVAYDLATYNPGINDPTARILAVDDGSYSASLDMMTKAPGSPSNPLQSRMHITSSGNVGIGTNNPSATLEVASTWNPQVRIDQLANDYARIRFAGYTYPTWDIAVQQSMNFFCNGYGNVLVLNNNGNATLSGTLSQGSDRNIKQGFTDIDPQELLAKVVALPISEWSYKTDTQSKHIGPMSQDFYAAFNVGPDDKHITTVDEGGVALSAIQGLNQKVEAQNAELRAENAELKRTNEAIEQKLDALEKLVQTALKRP